VGSSSSPFFAAGGRLTLTSGSPVTTSDVVGSSTIYYTPYLSDQIGLFSLGAWTTLQFAETSVPLGTLASGLPYDVFGYLSSGALAMEILAWTNGTTRATALVRQNGILCKSTDLTRRWLGTFYTSTTTTTEDSEANRLLFNADNRVHRYCGRRDTSNHSYYGNSWQPWLNSQENWQLQFINGDIYAYAINVIMAGNNIQNANNALIIDSTSWNYFNASAFTNTSVSTATIAMNVSCGYHFIVPVEYNNSNTSYMNIQAILFM